MSVTVRYDDGATAWILLDRPPLNLFDTTMQLGLRAAVAEVRQRAEVRAVVIKGANGNFSAGGDLKEMSTLSGTRIDEYATQISRLAEEIAALPVPVVAAVTGAAVGGGCELSLAADFRICSPTARFGLPEVALGVIPGAGGTQRLPRLIGMARAKELIFSGRHIDATEAVGIGLADQVVAETALDATARQWVQRFSHHPAGALRAAKQAVNQGVEMPLAQGLGLERELFADLLAHGEHTSTFHHFGTRRG
ncbi:enoyl-CoA hydratase/isomerase family protein [Micromonospora echinofusca]|uniref:Enoyl-CoA hydratase/isomerase family protein n=1 Tax=Micromonospora echinofusca TaxID=47858 RepID=A0ABS3VTQ1_MICEH|nr:enoyl-CoA hydratase/isomerase family protein [Micromonospora echinofusca]MBO4207893.1 enoyl-CoA hydratase/isomerase family protein [Micromonospora echinofusca]